MSTIINTMIPTFATTRLHPLFFITLAFIFGIFIQLYGGHLHVFGLIPLALLAFIARPICHTLFYLALICAYIVGGICLQFQKYNHACLYTYAAGQACDIVAQVNDIHPVDHPRFRSCITLTTHKIKHHTMSLWFSKSYTVQIYVRTIQDLAVGDIIAIDKLWFKQPSSKKSFDDYLAKEGIHSTLFITDFQYTLISRPQTCWRRTIYTLRNTLCQNLKNKMPATTYMLFSSIFLGNKYCNKKAFERSKEHFTTWGVTHYLARSGLHMVIFVMSWYFMLNFLPLPFFIKELFIIIMSILYCILSWPSISFVRAFLAFFMYKASTLIKQQTDTLHVLTVVCLIILCLNPMQLFFLDFQLSFGLTFALAYFNQLQTHHKNKTIEKTIA